MKWDDIGVKIVGRQSHHLRFAGDIVLITPNISQVEQVIDDFDKACGKIGLRLNLAKTVFIRNGLVTKVPLTTLNGMINSECFSTSVNQNDGRHSSGVKQK
uniref:Reverse transcriptase domain-containing protein n=1 Tax=Angiostrongylus cantonensis TaxID=6313 RepID=A0A0K0D708_ANGCA